MNEIKAFQLINGSENEATIEITSNEYIAEGAFGSVYKALLKLKSEPGEAVGLYAVKQIKCTCQDKVLQYNNKNRELGILKHLNHPNIVSLKFYFESYKDVWVFNDRMKCIQI